MASVALNILPGNVCSLRHQCMKSLATSCASAAEIMAVLFYSVMRYGPHNPRRPNNDLLSKMSCPSYPLCRMVRGGRFSTREAPDCAQDRLGPGGAPHYLLPFVDVATASLGQGVCVEMALKAKRFDYSGQRIFVLMGDGESAEGSVWGDGSRLRSLAPHQH
jgi:transketolase